MHLLLTSAAFAAWPDLATEIPASSPRPGDSAVIVGIEDYAFVADIPGARRNARDWYLWLTSGQGVPADRITLLEDQAATREEILAGVQRATQAAGTDGRTWVVFVGHGAPAADGTDGLLLGADVQQTARSVAARGVTQTELIAAGDGGQLVMVLDACFSGRDTDGQALLPGLQPMIPTYAAPTGSSTVLTAAAGDQFAGPLPGEDRPAFSYLVLGALQGWGDADGDGVVTAQEATAYTTRAMLTAVQDRSQTPSLRGADLPLGGSGRAPVDLAAQRLTQGPAPVPMPAEPEPEPRAVEPVVASAAKIPRPPSRSRAATVGWGLCTLAGAATTYVIADSLGAVGSGALTMGCATGTMVAGQQTLNRTRVPGRGPDPLAIGSWVGYGTAATGGLATMGMFATAGGDETTILLTEILAVAGGVTATTMMVDVLLVNGRSHKGTVSVRPTLGGIAGTF